MKLSNIYYTYKMNLQTKFLEEYVNFVDSAKDQNNYFNVIIILFVIFFSLLLYFVFFKL